MKKSNMNTTEKRLKQIEEELKELKEKRSKLKAKWSIEKNKIQEIQDTKAEIENMKHLAEKMEREGNLDKVAEIRYGKIHELESKLKDANERLAEVQSEGKLLNEEVTDEDIAEIVSKWTGIPVSKMLETERQKLLKMEDRIHERVIGQDEAVITVSNAIRRTRAGLQDENRPIGSFIFLGTTGIGKTELARALAEFLFDDENSMVRIDMSEYMDKFSVTRLIGAPPGYVGYDEGGQLTEAVRRNPYSVILLDEIEKAHQDVFNVLLQVLDDGRLTDSKGRTVNFKNSIIIMTSNLGTELIQNRLTELTDENRDSILSEIKTKIIGNLRQVMRPEFLNRIDEIVLFKPLLKSEIKKIAFLQLENLRKRIVKQGYFIEFTDESADWLANIGYDANFGARPLKRAIQKYISDPLAVHILSGKFNKGDKIMVDVDSDGKFTFERKE